MIDNGSPPVWDMADPWTWAPMGVMIVIIAGIWVYVKWRFFHKR